MDIQRGKSKTIVLVPEAPMTSPVATVHDRRGEQLVPAGSISVTASSVSTSVSAVDANTRSRFEVASTYGIEPGLFVRVTDESWGEAVAEVAGVEDVVVRLVEPLPGVPADGAEVVGLNLTVELTSDYTQDLDVGYVLEVTDEDDEQNQVRMAFAVVRYPFQGPCLARHVRERIARGFPGELLRDEQFHKRVAFEVNGQIRARLLAAQQYVSRYWDPKALEPVRPAMLRLVLADQFGLREGGSTRDDYLEHAEREVAARIQDVLRSAEIYDTDGDGEVDADEATGVRRWTMRLDQ